MKVDQQISANATSMVVLVHLDNGGCHQVYATEEQMINCLHGLKGDNGRIKLSPKMKPVTLEEFNET